MTLVIVAIVIAAFLIVALTAYWVGWRHGQTARRSITRKAKT